MHRLPWIWTAVVAASVGVLAAGAARFVGGENAGIQLWQVWLGSGWKTGLWLFSALGLGIYAHQIAFGRSRSGGAAALALGMALQMALDQWLGTLGLLHGLLAASVFIPGSIMALHFLWKQGQAPIRNGWRSILWWWPALPAIVALLIAASIPPGILWSTEFGGYDALEYHLQAPKEWLAIGAIRPLDHLAYSGMPNFVEGAFLHLMSLGTDARDGAVACQLLHAGMLIVTALALAETAAMHARQFNFDERLAKAASWCCLLATPWMIVTGSLAYTEAGILLAFAALLNVLSKHPVSPVGGGMCVGALIAALIGSKASSAILVVPAVCAWSAVLRKQLWINGKALGWCAVVIVLASAPWAIRNWMAASSPFFPLVSNGLGTGWWSPEQAARWNHAHTSDLSLASRVRALWDQLLVFGIHEAPVAGEPWKWFWGPLPWIGMCSLVVLAWRSATRPLATALALCSAFIIAGWLLGTHLQSRFLIPLAIPLALAFGLAAAGTLNMKARMPLQFLLCAWACLPAWFLAVDTPGAACFIGQNQFFTGDDDWRDLHSSDPAVRAEVQKNLTAELVINHLQPTWRVLSVGWSTPFWIRPDAALTWSTVWDSNPIEKCCGLPPAEAAELLGKNFDAILIDFPMLQRWKRSGWLSPDIDLDRLNGLASSLPRLASLRGGRILFGLNGNVALDPTTLEQKNVDRKTLPAGRR